MRQSFAILGVERGSGQGPPAMDRYSQIFWLVVSRSGYETVGWWPRPTVLGRSVLRLPTPSPVIAPIFARGNCIGLLLAMGYSPYPIHYMLLTKSYGLRLYTLIARMSSKIPQLGHIAVVWRQIFWDIPYLARVPLRSGMGFAQRRLRSGSIAQ